MADTDTYHSMIRGLRERLHLTQRELAVRAGVSRYYLGRLERGEASYFRDWEPCPTCGHKETAFTPQAVQVLIALGAWGTTSAGERAEHAS